MKCTLVLVVLCALVATICAMPEPLQHKQQQQLRFRQQMVRPVAMAQMQRRMWSPKWAMRRSSEEGVIAEDQTIAELDEQAAVEQLADETAAVAADEEQAAVAADEEVVADEAAPAEDDARAALVPSFPPHTFFPMNFGQTSGGSVAVANSFSTGGGNAYSHAVAHGQKKH